MRAAAAKLRDPDLTERYCEEWLANLRGRTHLQQWRDAISLLLRGACATRWAYHGIDHFRPRVVVASRAMMALVVAIGMVLLFTTMASLMIPLWVYAPQHFWISARPYPSIFAISLTTAGTIGLALLTRQSWRTALGWLLIGIFAILAFASFIPYNMYYIGPQGGHFQHLLAVAVGIRFADAQDWWAVTASYWILYAALTLFVSHKTLLVMRVLAASEVVVIINLTKPEWVYAYADRVGLTGFGVAPGIGFLLGILIVVAAWRCLVIVKSLVGARIWSR